MYIGKLKMHKRFWNEAHMDVTESKVVASSQEVNYSYFLTLGRYVPE